ncbi:transcription factor 23 isoform X2 [Mauremys mutica]|uniref:transcription factor 23 isoform X2 n=1 Tax=Mauremys mutica TaxID=74926 RepID=UPI001D16165D|nr:transcription factor 23 isoform X2 [Mauremys mutica]
MGADCPGWPGTSSTAGLGMAESTFAGAEGKRMETCSPRPASAPAGGKMRGSPGTPRLPPGWRRASQREGHASCALPRGSVGKLCPENAARERSRVRTLRQAFLALQAALPSVPPDTKLSKLDVLVLATSYIAHLTHTLHQGQPPPEAAPLARAPSFLHPMKKWPMRSRLYAGAWGADVADIPAAAPAVPSSRMRRACEGGSPGAGGAAL